VTPEGRVKEEVKKLLKEYGVYRFMPVQTGMGAPGLDFFCCYKGRFFAIETKTMGGRPTPRQRKTMDEIEAAGGATFLVDGGESLYALDKWLRDVDTVQRILGRTS